MTRGAQIKKCTNRGNTDNAYETGEQGRLQRPRQIHSVAVPVSPRVLPSRHLSDNGSLEGIFAFAPFAMRQQSLAQIPLSPKSHRR